MKSKLHHGLFQEEFQFTAVVYFSRIKESHIARRFTHVPNSKEKQKASNWLRVRLPEISWVSATTVWLYLHPKLTASISGACWPFEGRMEQPMAVDSTNEWFTPLQSHQFNYVGSQKNKPLILWRVFNKLETSRIRGWLPSYVLGVHVTFIISREQSWKF